MYVQIYLRMLKLQKTKFYFRLKMLRVKIKINLPRYAIERKNERRSLHYTQQHYANDIQLRIVIQQTIRKCFVNRVNVTRECLQLFIVIELAN